MVVTTVPLGRSALPGDPAGLRGVGVGRRGALGLGRATGRRTQWARSSRRSTAAWEVLRHGGGVRGRRVGAGARGAGAAGGAGLVLATEIAPLPGRGGARAVPRALLGSLRRLGAPFRRSLPGPLGGQGGGASAAPPGGAGGLREAWLRPGGGVSNVTAAELREAHAALAAEGLPLASAQVRYSALDRGPERDGVLGACRELGVTLLAYSPLAQGALAGTYTADRPPPGPRAACPTSPRPPARRRALVALLRAVGGRTAARGPEQVALNWLRAKPGVIPVVGATSGDQARRCAASLGGRSPTPRSRASTPSRPSSRPPGDGLTAAGSLSLPTRDPVTAALRDSVTWDTEVRD